MAQCYLLLLPTTSGTMPSLSGLPPPQFGPTSIASPESNQVSKSKHHTGPDFSLQSKRKSLKLSQSKWSSLQSSPHNCNATQDVSLFFRFCFTFFQFQRIRSNFISITFEQTCVQRGTSATKWSGGQTSLRWTVV